MPVSVIVGGQYGSEGKGKVAHFFARKYKADAVIRVGGPNSGHTVIDENNQAVIFKQLPTAAIIKNTKCVLTAGNYINLEILQYETAVSKINDSDLLIDPYAVIITQDDINNESNGDLISKIGSTGCGLGSAIIKRISRSNEITFARDVPILKKYLCDTNNFLRNLLKEEKRIIIEGTQGFGLSVLHSNEHPYCTSRDTTAAGFVSEAGLSPLDIDDIIMVIRAFPIRVAGNSGPLKNETTWEKISAQSGSEKIFKEYTSVSKKLRRIAEFDEEVVKKAIRYNNPTKIVLNHLDYVDSTITDNQLTSKIKEYKQHIEDLINSKIEFIGLDNKGLITQSEAVFNKLI